MLDKKLTTFQELVRKGRITFLAIDGLDGSGKQTTTAELAKILNYSGKDVLTIALPYYKSTWGEILAHLLQTNDEELDLDEKIAVYALNRLEIVPTILNGAIEIIDASNRPLVIIFDRYPTSSMLTLAYYHHNHPNKLKILNEESILRHYKKIWELDSEFSDILGGLRERTNIHILKLPSEHAINSIDNDISRNKKDLYERTDVQTTAGELFEMMGSLSASEEISEKFFLHEQIGPDMKRISPTKLAELVLSTEKWDTHEGIASGITRSLESFKFIEDPSASIATNELAIRYPKLLELLEVL